MSTKPKIFENALLVSLEVKLFGATKTSRQLTRQLIEQNDIKEGRARASVDIIPKEYERGIRKPVTDARRTIKQYTTARTIEGSLPLGLSVEGSIRDHGFP